MNRLCTAAVVLGASNYGESDRIVTLLGRELGKVRALARAARKSTRRFGAGLGLFSLGTAELTEKHSSDLVTLESFDCVRGFAGLTADLGKVAYAGYAAELVRELCAWRHPEPQLFELLVECLSLVEAEPIRPEMLRLFELLVLDAHGLRPELERCVRCSDLAQDEAGQGIEGASGGVVCGRCAQGRARALNGATRRALLRAQGLSLRQHGALDLPSETNRQAREALAALIAAHIGKPLQSVEFIHKINQATL